MRSILTIIIAVFCSIAAQSQVMTPELLWQLKRVSPIGLSDDGQSVLFNVSQYSIEANARSTKTYKIPISGGDAIEISDYDDIYTHPALSPNGDFELITKEVKIKPILGSEHYPGMEQSNVYIYDNLNYRHWDKWEDGYFSHLFIKDQERGTETDLNEGEAFDVPQQPFGGAEDYTWNHDGSKVYYVCKKEYGTAYAQSTNTDIYQYDLGTKQTTNLTESNKGYDTHPVVSGDGTLAWLQMDEPGYESDKNDIILLEEGEPINLTRHWDGTVYSFIFAGDGKKIYFTAPVNGTRQLFELPIPKKGNAKIKQVTDGQFDVNGLVGLSGNTLVVTRTDMNHASEIYTVNLKNGEMSQLTRQNDDTYNKIRLSKVEKRRVTTTDGKEMVTWVIYPPDFDPNKKYPTLLYCQGGPQGALSQFYSFRWNFQLMAAQGYIVVAPNRRGMPGYGVEWNEQISGDWGGQNMQDYLAAIDDVAKEDYVDSERLGCVGASYGGYSAFYLAGIHEGRFKSFIAHDGVFNLRSMYGTTEELFFVNKDFGGAYWEEKASKTYDQFNPIDMVAKWDTPILVIQGGKDYRVPIGQGLEAFQAAQLQGIKSKLLYFPDENHWVLSAQNGVIWQREFYKWLDETLK
ncbi:MAG: S9 family peptidase [Cytophagales bacterium]|nr:S9 family peptidase [Cytophagales bacterium]